MNKYPSVVPYLLVADGAALVSFLERGFGAKRRLVMSGPTGGIQHAEIELGDGLIMISDSSEMRSPSHLCFYVANVDGVYETALAAGAVSTSAPETKDYGQRVAGVTDPAGNMWWICAETS